jgi:hypothetical protein
MTAYASVGVHGSHRARRRGAVSSGSRLEGQRVSVYRGDRPFSRPAICDGIPGSRDAALRAKYTLLLSARRRRAIAGQCGLPTGQEANLSARRISGFRIFGIARARARAVMLSATPGSQRQGVVGRVQHRVAAAVRGSPETSLTGEFLARPVDELRPLVRFAAPHPTDRRRRRTNQAGSSMKTEWL